MKFQHEFWERRGVAIYTEGDFQDREYVPGSAQLVKEFPAGSDCARIQKMVDDHNELLAFDLGHSENTT